MSIDSAPAQLVQETAAGVSNINQASTGTVTMSLSTASPQALKQPFTTGSNAGGYQISSVSMALGDISDPTPGQNAQLHLRVRILDSQTSSGKLEPGSSICGRLTPPVLEANAVNTWTTGQTCSLDANSIYFVELKYMTTIQQPSNAPVELKYMTAAEVPDSGDFAFDPSHADSPVDYASLDGGSSAGWKIPLLHKQVANDATVTPVPDQALLVDVNDAVAYASLSGLSLSAGWLSPAFDSDTTTYTASVGYSVTRVTVTAAKNDDDATVAYLDGNDEPLTDADTAAEGQQVDLSVGDNVVKVRVTAPDAVTRTYTVTISRTAQDTSLSPAARDPVAAFASTAEYTITFQGAWTSAVTPGGVPFGGHFSRLVGGVHNVSVAFLESGGTSSAGVEAMAEEGGWTGLRDEVLAAAPDALSSLSGGTDSISATGSDSLTATLTTEHPRVTLVTMIAPSHDWFVGVSGLPLLDSDGRWLRSHEVSLYPWDAGTEDGTDFSLSPSDATDPQGTIESARGTGPFTTEPIATLSFALQSVATTRQVAENTAAATDIGAPVAAAGTSGTVAYTLSGTDAASFDVVASTGQLQTKAALDHETKSSYEVTVTATDTDGATDTAVTIEVDNVIELSSVSGPAGVTHPENDAGRVGSYSASSAQDRDGIEWSLSGDDAAHFSIDDPGGALRFHIDAVSPNLFAKPPDYESPTDTGSDNDYEVTLHASTAGSSTEATKAVTVTVSDTDEAGTLTLSSTRPRLGTGLTTTLSDPDSVDGTPTYTWERSTRPNAWKTIAGATSSTYTPAAADTGTFLRATATYTDGHGAGKSAAALTYEVVTARLLTGLQVSTGDSSANPARALSPSFISDVLHYAVGCAAAGDTMTVTPTAASGVRIAVNGVQTASGTAATVTVNRESDVHVTLTTAAGAATTYVVHCLVGPLWILEAAKTPGATGVLEDLILLNPSETGHTVAMLDNNAVPRFRRDVGQRSWVYFRVDRVAGADQQQGHDLEYRYSYVKEIPGAYEFTVLDQSLEKIDTAVTTVAPLETTDLHDFRVLENGNYLLLAYEPAQRDLSDLPFDHPDVEDSQPQTVLDSAIQIVTPAGQAVFTWNSWGIMPLEDCAQHRFPSGYGHINSLQMVDGLIIASFRGCSKVLAIDPDHTEDHKVAWRVGRTNLVAEQWEARGVGPAPMAVVGDPAGEFCGQHAAQVLPNGNLILFDNGVECLVNPWTGEEEGRTSAVYSRAVEYALDHDNGEAVFVRDHSLRGARQYLGNTNGQVEPLANGDWLISWGRARRQAEPGEAPIEAVTQVDPATGEEKFSLRDPDDPTFHVRAIPIHPVALFAEPQPLAAEFPASSHTSRATLGPADLPKVVVVFNQPVVDFAAATASVIVEGATVTGVSPHVVAGEAANAYLLTLTPTGYGSITLSLVTGQACDSGDSGGVCTADGRTLSAVPDPHRIAATPQPSPEAQTAAALVKNTDQTATQTGLTLDAEDGPTVAAQGFTTGSNHDGYALSSIGVGFQTISDTSTAGRELTASLHDAATVLGDIVGPGRALCTLNDPASFSSSGLHHFAAPTSGRGLCPTLAPSTTYFVRVQRELEAVNTIRIDATHNYDSGAAAGWSLEDGLVYVDPELGSVSAEVWTFATANIQIEVRGAPYPISRSVIENTAPDRDIGTAVAFIEPDGGSLTYTLEGDDAASFDIVDSTGQLRTKTALDHESKSNYEVTVTATNPSGVSAQNTVDIGVTDINEAPVVSGGTVFSFEENDSRVVGVFTFVDPDSGDTVDWSLSAPGSDADLFSIAGGVLSFLAPPDFEARADADRDNVYELVVEADDGELTGTLAVSVTVTNVNEAPEVDRPPMADFAENSLDVVATYTATDPENNSVGWSLQGDDMAAFDIADGRLSFKAPPDFEARSDADGDNVYELVVEADDGELTGTLTVSVTVTNVNEPGVVRLSAVQPQADERLDASLSDPDGEVASSVRWQWQASTNRVSWNAIAGAVSSSYTPVYDDVGRYLRAQASYHDGYGLSEQAQAESQNRVLAAPMTNQPPTFAAGTVTRQVAEDAAAGSQVGDAVTASDPEGDTLTYSIDSPDGTPFEIVPATGQLLTTAVLDHETADSHTLTVRAEDPSGAAATTQVEVEVSDVNEAPVVSGAEIESFEENGTGAVAAFTASDPDDRDTVSWDLDGPDAGLFSIDGGVLRFETPPDYDKPADRGRDNSYEVVVQATDGGGLEGTLDVAVNVRNANEPPGIAGEVAVSVPERRRAVATYTADDPEGVAVGWDLDGSDAGLFSIDGGVLRFETPPDFEAPADSNGDNDYLVTVEVTDGAHTSRLDVTVTVTDVDENRPPPGIGFGGFGGGGGGGPGPGGGEPEPEAQTLMFGDVEDGAYYEPAVAWMIQEGITVGCASEPPRYCPGEPVTRAQMASFLSRALDLEAPARRAGFADVEPSGGQAGAIEALYGAGITVGCASEPLRYCPGEPVTRAQMASFLSRALDLEAPARRAGFADVEPSGVHAGAIEALYGAGITVGCAQEPLRYCPDRPVTRAQMAAFLYRARNLIAAAGSGS